MHNSKKPGLATCRTRGGGVGSLRYMNNTSSVVSRVVPYAVAFITFGSVMTQAAFGWFNGPNLTKCASPQCTNFVSCGSGKVPCCCKRAPATSYTCECQPASELCANGVGVNCLDGALPPAEGEGP